MREAESPTDCPRCGTVVAKKQLSVCCMSVSGGSSNATPAGCGPGGRFT